MHINLDILEFTYIGILVLIIMSQTTKNEDDVRRQRDFNQQILDSINNARKLKINFYLKGLRADGNVLYRNDFQNLMHVLKIKNSPVFITGTTTRHCINSMDIINVRILAATLEPDSSYLRDLKQLLSHTSSPFPDETYQTFITSTDYNNNSQQIENIENIEINALYYRYDMESKTIWNQKQL